MARVLGAVATFTADVVGREMQSTPFTPSGFPMLSALPDAPSATVRLFAVNATGNTALIEAPRLGANNLDGENHSVRGIGDITRICTPAEFEVFARPRNGHLPPERCGLR